MGNSGLSVNLLEFEALLRPTKSKPRLHLDDGMLVPKIAWPTIQLDLISIFVDIDPKALVIDLIRAQGLSGLTKNSVAGIFPIHPLEYSIPPSQLKSIYDFHF
jgi:hypothetical protein